MLVNTARHFFLAVFFRRKQAPIDTIAVDPVHFLVYKAGRFLDAMDCSGKKRGFSCRIPGKGGKIPPCRKTKFLDISVAIIHIATDTVGNITQGVITDNWEIIVVQRFTSNKTGVVSGFFDRQYSQQIIIYKSGDSNIPDTSLQERRPGRQTGGASAGVMLIPEAGKFWE